MFSLIYVSSALNALSPRELRDLLDRCNENNRRQNVTGMLLYKDGNFMQALEGEQSAVLSLHAKIARDPRHHGLITLLKGKAQERQFPDWSMGFRDLGADIDYPEGYSDFLNTPLTGREFQAEPTKAQQLLLAFKKVSTR